MPNWVSNGLRITGDKKQLAKFIKQAQVHFTIEIPKKDVKKEYDKIMSDVQSWRNRLEEYTKAKKMTPLSYFKQMAFKNVDEFGNVGENGTPLSMRNFIPIPEELSKYTSPVRAEFGETEEQFKERVARCINKYGAEDWYQFSINNFSTKWDLNEVSFKFIDEEEVQYGFETAWFPPIAFLQNISKKFHKLKFELEYREEGMAFEGTFEIENGDEIDECHNIENDADDTCHD